MGLTTTLYLPTNLGKYLAALKNIRISNFDVNHIILLKLFLQLHQCTFEFLHQKLLSKLFMPIVMYRKESLQESCVLKSI